MRVVILGTGTDVGKTYVTAALARGLAQRISVLALKPVESGVQSGVAGDAGTIAQAAGHAPWLSPWRFPRPVSPHLAARESGRLVELAAVASWVAECERQRQAQVTLIELAGGAFSPLAAGVTNADLAAELNAALWLLVAPDSLGVLHDLSATLRALSRRPDAIVLSSARAPDQSTGSNAPELAALGIAEVLEVVAPGGEAPRSVDWLLQRSSLASR